jgi:hypothetical protein
MMNWARIWKEAVVALFSVLSQNLPGRNMREIYEIFLMLIWLQETTAKPYGQKTFASTFINMNHRSDDGGSTHL